MIKRVKKYIAGICALVIMVTNTACGADTKWAVEYNDYEARAGIFLYYQMSSYYEAVTTLTEDDPDFDTTNTKALKTATIDDTPIVEWIQNDATEKVKLYLEVISQFDELGLSLTDEEQSTVDSVTDTYWEYYGDYYTQNGIGKESFGDINIYSYKRNYVFDYYYGTDGVEEVDAQELKDYYEENNARVKYICLNSTDSDGNFMSDEMQSLAEDYMQRANSGEEFDDLIDEYNQYKTDLAAEQEAEAEAESDDDSTSSIDSDIAESSNTEDNEEIDDDTATIGDSDENETVEETTEEEEEDEYANEYIITKSEDESSGSPTYTVNQAIFEHSNYGDAFIVEEENAYYVVVRYDIWDRDDLWTADTQETVLKTLYSDTFDEKMLSLIDESAVTINEKALKRYNPFDMEF